MPITRLSKKNVAVFCVALKDMLQDGTSQFGKQYLRLLLDDIRVIKKEVHLRGSHAALASALSSESDRGLNKVPSFDPYWLPSADSNHGQDG